MRKLLLGIILLILPLLLFVRPSSAQEFRKQEHAILKKGDVVNKDFFAAGEAVTLSGTVNGDAYLTGGSILVDGKVNGDLIVAGGNVVIRGEITDDIRAAGGNITVSSPIGGSLTVFGGSVVITDTASVKGSVVAAAGSLELFGPIGKGITAGAGSFTVGNNVGGDIVTGTGRLSLTQNASVNGTITYLSEQKAQVSEGASISGQLYHRIPERVDENKAKGIAAGLFSFITIVDVLLSFILGLLFLKLFPIFSKNVTTTIVDHPWKSLGVGFITLIVFPLLGIFLLITIVGIPLGIVLLFGLFVLMYIGKVFTAYVVGGKIGEVMNLKLNNIWLLLIGILLFVVISWIPILGGLTLFVTVLIGMGALLSVKKNYYKELRTKKLI